MWQFENVSQFGKRDLIGVNPIDIHILMRKNEYLVPFIWDNIVL